MIAIPKKRKKEKEKWYMFLQNKRKIVDEQEVNPFGIDTSFFFRLYKYALCNSKMINPEIFLQVGWSNIDVVLNGASKRLQLS